MSKKQKKLFITCICEKGVITIVKVIKNQKSDEEEERFEDRVNAKLDKIAEVVI